jgi:hypothetical protein
MHVIPQLLMDNSRRNIADFSQPFGMLGYLIFIICFNDAIMTGLKQWYSSVCAILFFCFSHLCPELLLYDCLTGEHAIKDCMFYNLLVTTLLSSPYNFRHSQFTMYHVRLHKHFEPFDRHSCLYAVPQKSANLCTFQFPVISNSTMMGTSEVTETLAQLSVRS